MVLSKRRTLMSKTTKKPETKTAAQVFAERKVDVEAKLARVNAAIAKHLGNQNPNWAETADLGRCNGWLTDMLEVLEGTGE